MTPPTFSSPSSSHHSRNGHWIWDPWSLAPSYCNLVGFRCDGKSHSPSPHNPCPQDMKAAGCLSGHIEGITFIDSRGDGRYFISNGKDQSIKLWDIRKMSSKPEYFKRKGPHFDYRYMPYPAKAKALKHPKDQSIATYRGHSVLSTLIRCHFSPHNTGQKYIYTGSHDGCVYIYEVVTGTQVAKLDLSGSTVRDCSWHPHYPILVGSSWDCIVGRWEFPGTDSKRGLLKKGRRRQVESLL